VGAVSVAMQDLRAGGRQSNAQYQYTLQSANVQDLYTWTPRLVDALEHSPVLADVSSDLQQSGLETYLDIDRNTTARLGISPQQIDNTPSMTRSAQRQVSTIYNAINQYHVVMEPQDLLATILHWSEKRGSLARSANSSDSDARRKFSSTVSSVHTVPRGGGVDSVASSNPRTDGSPPI